MRKRFVATIVAAAALMPTASVATPPPPPAPPPISADVADPLDEAIAYIYGVMTGECDWTNPFCRDK